MPPSSTAASLVGCSSPCLYRCSFYFLRHGGPPLGPHAIWHGCQLVIFHDVDCCLFVRLDCSVSGHNQAMSVEFVTVFNSSGVIEDVPFMWREAPQSMMDSKFSTDVVGREMLPMSKLPCQRGRKTVECRDTSLSCCRYLRETSRLSLELRLQDTRSNLRNLRV